MGDGDNPKIPLRSVKIPYGTWERFAAVARGLGMKTGPMIVSAVVHFVECPHRQAS